MRRVRDGDTWAFKVLMNRYWQRLSRYGRDVTGDLDSAEDVAQETFVRAWEHRRSWQPTGSVSAYLYRIARNLALNRVRDDRSRRDRTDVASSGGLPTPIPRTPEQELEASRVVIEIRDAIDSLPARRREIFTLSRFHLLSYVEIAEAMEISTQTVANQMSKALADLRCALSHLY